MLTKMVLFTGLAMAAITWTAAPASAQYYPYQGPGNGPGCGPPGVYGCGAPYRSYGWSGSRHYRSPYSAYNYDRRHGDRHYH
jgi:hypothetical protein